MDTDAILTFRDENGDEWLAAAIVGPLWREAPAPRDTMDLHPGLVITKIDIVIDGPSSRQ